MGKKIEAEDPEWDAADFATAQPVEAFPELSKVVKPGRPTMPEEARKKRVTMYLDPDVLARLKEGGRGWQTRANAALREALGLAG